MKRIIIGVGLFCVWAAAHAWCLSGYTEVADPCQQGYVICLAPGQSPPGTCPSTTNQQQQQNQTSNNTNKNSNKNTNNNSNTNNNLNQNFNENYTTSTATSSSNAQGGQGGAGGAGGAGGQGGGGGSVGNTSASTGASNGGGAYIGATTETITESAAKIPVNTAIAPTVITGSDQCLVPVSGSVQTTVVGVAVGSAVADKNCEALKLSDRLKYLGQYEAAVRILAIQDPRVEQALHDVGGYKPVVDSAIIRPLKRNEYEGRTLGSAAIPAVSPSINLNH